MKKFILVLAALLGTAPVAFAETQAAANSRVMGILQKEAGISSADIVYLVKQLKSSALYATAAELVATAPDDGVFAYALDTDVFYLRANGNWVTLSSVAALTLVNGATIANDVDGTIVITEGGEAWTIVYTNNLITFASTTGATFAITPAIAFAGDISLGGGAGALTCSAAGCSLLATDNSATGWVAGSTGATATLTLDTRDGVEGVIVTGYQTTSGLTTATGGLKTTKPFFLYDKLRFCGNGSNGATAWYDGPVLASLTSDYSIGSGFCDALDSGTEATADAPIDPYHVIKVVSMECVTQAGGAADTNTFQLRSATADVSGVTCSVTNDGSLAKQCNVILSSPVTIAVGATLAVKNTQSGTDDMSAKDMGCTVYYSY